MKKAEFFSGQNYDSLEVPFALQSYNLVESVQGNILDLVVKDSLKKINAGVSLIWITSGIGSYSITKKAKSCNIVSVEKFLDAVVFTDSEEFLGCKEPLLCKKAIIDADSIDQVTLVKVIEFCRQEVHSSLVYTMGNNKEVSNYLYSNTKLASLS